MREIKFRGYSKGKLIGSQWITNGYGVSKINYTDGTSSVHLLTPYGDYWVEEDSIGQYTGLKDKNGKEICEGDIVSYFKDELAEIKLKKGCFAIESENYIDYFHEILGEIEVVGNIYENKELLA